VRLGRFSLVGLLGAVLQLVLVWTLNGRLGIGATPVAVELVVLHNFLWHERFTWRDRRATGVRAMAMRLWRFHAANGLVSLIGNTALMYGLVDRLKAPVLPSAAAAIAVCSIVNFLLADRWVYAVRS
jgi:putative flippase GtrA